MTFTELPNLLTQQEAAKLLRVTTRTIRDWEKEGRIPYTQIGRNHLYLRDDITDLIYQNYRR